MQDPSNPSIVIGTAGHIDHGKSTLVQALTGTDPDRLAEEKKRGITIELGFARLDFPDGSYAGIVDVPGHERFVRQMISGASGIDIALVCIAADDGVMPQTREHLAVLDVLGIRQCVVALTKTDLADADWTQFVMQEVRDTLGSTPFGNAPIIPVSARTGEGVEDIRAALFALAHETTRSAQAGFARLPIDRVFTIKGAGTVVTGTLWAGSIAVGDELEVLPHGIRARVRGIQVHGENVEAASSGNRTALNLVNVKTEDVRPGDFLVTPGSIAPTDRFDARISYLGAASDAPAFESGAKVHIAHGTKEVVGRVLLMNGRASLPASESAYCQIRTDEALPVTRTDRFVVRSYSPVRVIGGGVVLSSHPKRRTNLSKADERLIDALMRNDIAEAAASLLDTASIPLSANEAATRLDASPSELRKYLEALASDRKAIRIEAKSAPYYLAPALHRKLLSSIENALLDFHAKNPASTGLSKGALRDAVGVRADDDAFEALLSAAVAENKAVAEGGEVSHPRAGGGAKKIEQQAVRTIAEALAAGGAAPETWASLIEGAKLPNALAHKALKILENDGRAVRVSRDLVYDATALEALGAAVASRLETAGSASAADLKEAMGISRKYAIPVLEHFDAIGLTVREGDLRALKANRAR